MYLTDYSAIQRVRLKFTLNKFVFTHGHSVSSVIALQYIQVFAPLGRTADSRQHATELRQRARLPRLLARHGHHHLLDDHVLRREERRGYQVPQHPGRLLVHHRHHDHARVSRRHCYARTPSHRNLNP